MINSVSTTWCIYEQRHHFSSPQSLHTYTYAHNNAVKHIDPSGHLIPLLLAVWAVAEFSLSVYDAYSTYDTVTDPCSIPVEKGLTVALFIGGLFLPDGGYTSGAKAVGKSVKALATHLDNVDEVFDATLQVRKMFSHSDEAAAAGNSFDNAAAANDLIKVTDDLPCIGNSFVAGTLVDSENGLVAIETLREGVACGRLIPPQVSRASTRSPGRPTTLPPP